MAVAALAVGALVGATLLRGEAVTVEEQRDAVVAEKTSLAEQIRAACQSGDLAGPVCGQAEQVLAEPIPGPRGPTGLPGRDGRDGQSPPCLSEPARCQGADGKDGTNGIDGKDGKDAVDGKDGRDGRDGSPAASYTSTFPDGSTQTCTRSGGPDTAPTYGCGPLQPPPDDDPPPTEGDGLLGG